MMTMGQLGEKGYIRQLFRRYRKSKAFTAKPGDAAIIRFDARPAAIALKIDRGPSAVSYKFGLSSRIVDGRLAATACCSDLLAVWSRPQALMISVTVPPETRTADLDAALDGFVEICEANGVEFVGGDTKAGPWNLVACGIGKIEGAAASRRAAYPGDVIVVCGEIGSFAAATLRAMNLTSSISLDEATTILSYPIARWAEAAWLRGRLAPSSATDSSDGMYEALLNVAGDGCGVQIDEEKLPFSVVARQVSDDTSVPLTNFLYGGGDWNLVLTMTRQEVESLNGLTPFDGAQMAVVGEVTSEPGFIMSQGGSNRRLKGIISDHFLGRIEDPLHYFEKLRSYSGWEDLL
jgi:thiamine-monophosphate kinase